MLAREIWSKVLVIVLIYLLILQPKAVRRTFPYPETIEQLMEHSELTKQIDISAPLCALSNIADLSNSIYVTNLAST